MIKQTQTKMFDFSDAGLDFCAGSKNKFPEVFKKMLVTGYNPQTAASVSITGDQVTLTFGVNHGYVADRVLAVTASGGFNKQVFIDSVTSNSVTFTQAVTTGLTGTITTRVASLGYNLVYEVGNIHIYKFKALDETDLFLRLCFQDIAARRNCISPCIGKTADLTLGTITDSNALTENTSITTPGNGFKWEFGYQASATPDNYTYSQGYSTYGLGVVIGSPYHLIVLSNSSTGTQRALNNGFFPTVCHDYDILKYPVLMGYTYGSITSSFDQYESRNMRAYIGSINTKLEKVISNPNVSYVFDHQFLASSAFLPSNFDNFNTTTIVPLPIFDVGSGQHLGYVAGGIFSVMSPKNTFPTGFQQTPSSTVDIDFNNRIFIHSLGSENAESTNTGFVAFPVEEIKIGY